MWVGEELLTGELTISLKMFFEEPSLVASWFWTVCCNEQEGEEQLKIQCVKNSLGFFVFVKT